MNMAAMNAKQLNVTTPSDREIAMTRTFDAPRTRVFECFTVPALVRRWLLGPDGWTMPVCEIDFRVGGAWRYVWRNADGREMSMSGEYREIAPPSRIVHVERFMGGEAIVTTLFAEHAGKTMSTMTMLFASAQARDGALKSGMERGVEASYRRLEGILSAP